MASLKKLQERLKNFNARGSNCPICGHEFRDEYNCPHSISEAIEHLKDKIFRAKFVDIMKKEMKKK